MKDREHIPFGLFVLDLRNNVLLWQGQPVALTRKSFGTLVVLASNPGRIVTKDELRHSVWPDVVVEEGTLAQNIFLIRKALNDGMPGFNFIETIAGVGYRFNLPRQAGESATAEIASRDRPAEMPPASSKRRRSRAYLGGAIAAISCSLLLVAAWWMLHGRKPEPPKSVAVLPFANLTGDPHYDYAAEGLADALLTDIGTLPGLRVLSGLSAHEATHLSATDLGAKLHVDALVEGAILMDKDRMLVDVRLVNAAHDRTLWAGRYDLDPHALLPIERTIRDAVSHELTTGTIAEHKQPTATTNVDAYDAYLLGRFYWEKRTESGYEKAIESFDRARSLDPGFAQAYAGLADTYALLGSMPNRVMSRRDAMQRARAAAERAISLNDTLAQAHASLAFILMHYDWNGRQAEAEFRRAIELDPNYATAHHWYAYLLMAEGRSDESLRQIHLAQQCDPVSPIIQTDVGELEFEHRDYAAAERESRRTLQELDSDFPLAHYWLARALLAQNKPAAAQAEFERAYQLSGNVWALSGMAVASSRLGQREKVNALSSKIAALCSGKPACAVTMVFLYTEQKRYNDAFRTLESAFAERDGALIFVNQDWGYDPLRDRDRFQRIARQVTQTLNSESSEYAAGPYKY